MFVWLFKHSEYVSAAELSHNNGIDKKHNFLKQNFSDANMVWTNAVDLNYVKFSVLPGFLQWELYKVD
jgi:hypothetical protein